MSFARVFFLTKITQFGNFFALMSGRKRMETTEKFVPHRAASKLRKLVSGSSEIPFNLLNSLHSASISLSLSHSTLSTCFFFSWMKGLCEWMSVVTVFCLSSEGEHWANVKLAVFLLFPNNALLSVNCWGSANAIQLRSLSLFKLSRLSWMKWDFFFVCCKMIIGVEQENHLLHNSLRCISVMWYKATTSTRSLKMEMKTDHNQLRGI